MPRSPHEVYDFVSSVTILEICGNNCIRGPTVVARIRTLNLINSRLLVFPLLHFLILNAFGISDHVKLFSRHARKLNHFHMKCLRRLLKIKVPDTEILTGANFQASSRSHRRHKLDGLVTLFACLANVYPNSCCMGNLARETPCRGSKETFQRFSKGATKKSQHRCQLLRNPSSKSSEWRHVWDPSCIGTH
jgi:hypothetical protein